MKTPIAPSLESIERCLIESGISYSLEESKNGKHHEFLLLGFETHRYRDVDGERLVAIKIWMERPCVDLFCIVLEVRKLFYAVDFVAGAILRILCEESGTNGICYTFSKGTGEITARLIVPLMSNRIETASFTAVVYGLAQAIDNADPRIQKVMDRNKKKHEEVMKENEERNREAIDNQHLGEDAVG